MSNKPEFHEDWQSEHTDPLDGRHEDFDFEAVDRALGNPAEGMTDESIEQLSKALVVVVQWLCDVSLKKGADTLIGRRAIALAWVLRPDIFQGMSVTEIATLLGTKKMNLSRWTAECSRVFGIRNRGQSHGWNYRQDAAPKQPKRKLHRTPSEQLPLF